MIEKNVFWLGSEGHLIVSTKSQYFFGYRGRPYVLMTGKQPFHPLVLIAYNAAELVTELIRNKKVQQTFK